MLLRQKDHLLLHTATSFKIFLLWSGGYLCQICLIQGMGNLFYTHLFLAEKIVLLLGNETHLSTIAIYVKKSLSPS